MGGGKIFISYRRKHALGSVRALYHELLRCFGSEAVFFDLANLDVGVQFPDALRAAIQEADVTLAVIDSEWLNALLTNANANAKAAGGPVDYVRQELKLALALQAASPGQRWVIPVLCECQEMPNPDALTPDLKDDLGALWAANKSLTLAGEHKVWEFAVRDLVRRLRALGAGQLFVVADDEARFRRVSAEVKALLADDDLKPLRQAWASDPLANHSSADVQSLVDTLGAALHQAQGEWKIGTDRIPFAQEKCRSILSLLYSLAIDGVKLRAWLERDDLDPMPVESVATLAFVHAVARNRRVQFLPVNAEGDWGVKGTADLSQLDPGIGRDRKAAVHGIFHRQVLPASKAAFAEPLQGDGLKKLAVLMEARARQQGIAFVVTDKARPGAVAPADVHEIARELRAAAVVRSGEHSGLLHVDEVEFNLHVFIVLEAIEVIQ